MSNNGHEPINPIPYENSDGTISHDIYIGLTKREKIAAMAMQGLCANYLRENVVGWDIKTYATESVALADALLKALEE